MGIIEEMLSASEGKSFTPEGIMVFLLNQALFYINAGRPDKAVDLYHKM